MEFYVILFLKDNNALPSGSPPITKKQPLQHPQICIIKMTNSCMALGFDCGVFSMIVMINQLLKFFY